MADRLSVQPQTDALIVVDVQNDFLPGGALPVPNGREAIPVLNQWLGIPDILKIASRDWHPPDHCSFKEQGGPWPPHCVRETWGAEFAPGLDVDRIDEVVSKATARDKEAYSAFDAPETDRLLRERGVRRLWIGGVATEYCVRHTALSALELGYEAFVLEDAIRGIEASPGDCGKAVARMKEAGAVFTITAHVAKT